MVDERDEPVCSAKGCRAAATYVLVWNNPRLHTPDREKTWTACEVHRGPLSEHLDVRGFLRRVDALRTSCPTCGASFPGAPPVCPVCAQVAAGGCGG